MDRLATQATYTGRCRAVAAGASCAPSPKLSHEEGRTKIAIHAYCVHVVPTGKHGCGVQVEGEEEVSAEYLTQDQAVAAGTEKSERGWCRTVRPRPRWQSLRIQHAQQRFA
ncbi:DUF2188 domain-containing protein [Ralstonia syzygii]|uniref:DUF2188 domain-containing protein n=1 Tax=Ralstonia syzygii TaxID=28097 RepID=UPI0036F39F58